ncbi:sigma-54-dependent Fis family transcriptional regulator [Rhodovarius crocodyli]|uniref:Sigma-54-dependent Fis family transcriptional regulator n=1 Tax=Rhodovarius crocodyli TaxID=1979269 RepID=A0A437MGX9_9PROT|nr:sigma-54 dependent transcriptional regulator [Rhodovarius crocodyli]RVT96845.1 sigma-54-dependent Fis family transcriptional regulator [Rhodovarius crocodyli]
MSETVTAPTGRVLLVEDTPTQAEVAKAMLAALGHEVRHAATGAQALLLAQEWPADAVLVDLQLPDFSGFELMRRLRAEGSEAAMIVLTANGSVNTAVEAMREGAIDFIVKPYGKARLKVTLDNALENRALRAELTAVKQQLNRGRFFGFVGASPAMQAVYRTIESVAPSRANVFITGESGTGKELAAEAIHKASPRAKGPFVAINCGAIPKDLIESEIFGHVKGAFTGAIDNRAGAARQAEGGTLFLDEVGEMRLDMQVKLLRFLQTGSFQPVGAARPEKADVRIVSATNRDPLAEVEAGRFREDLYYRLYVVPIALPPLRERGEDVLLIARHFLTRFAKEEGRRFRGFARETEAAISAYPWPGNVRQLQNAVRNVVVLHDGDVVTPGMLPPLPAPALPAAAPQPAAAPVPPMVAPPPAVAHVAAPPSPAPVTAFAPAPPPMAPPPQPASIEPLAVVERRCILAALDHTGQDVPKAAALLGVNPSTIYRKLAAWRSEGVHA